MQTERSRSPYRIEMYDRPGLTMDDHGLQKLMDELAAVAATCFNPLPEYQVMAGTRAEMSDKIISVALDNSNAIKGFCSVVLLPVKGVGNVLHLGLTCVHPDARRNHLTHKLIKKAVLGYLLKRNPFGKQWISNCAAVLSSLGNVAVNFDAVYPSPFTNTRPTRTHLKIGETIDREYRHKMFILPDAVFDREKFVFRRSVKDTVFVKSASDYQYYHRRSFLNRFYSGLMNFDEGDEVLQIGYFRMASALKYFLRQRKIQKIRTLDTSPVQAM